MNSNTNSSKRILVPVLLGAGACTLTAAGIFTNVFYSPLGSQNDDYHILAPFRTEEERERSLALINRLRARPYESVSILSRDRLRLCGRYYHQADGAPLAILCHGYRGTPVRDLALMSALMSWPGRNMPCSALGTVSRFSSPVFPWAPQRC